jgi:sigma-B regulation protein RsbU (phosphoserine phosphatase)
VEKIGNRFSAGIGMPFFSLLYGTVDLKAGVVTLVRAGQPFPLLQKSDGGLQILRIQGHALGVVAELRLAEHQFPWERGDRLFLCSDGLVECRNPDMTQFSEDRLAALIRGTRTAGLSEAVASIDAQVLQWRAGTEFDDDICLLALERV